MLGNSIVHPGNSSMFISAIQMPRPTGLLYIIFRQPHRVKDISGLKTLCFIKMLLMEDINFLLALK